MSLRYSAEMLRFQQRCILCTGVEIEGLVRTSGTFALGQLEPVAIQAGGATHCVRASCTALAARARTDTWAFDQSTWMPQPLQLRPAWMDGLVAPAPWHASSRREIRRRTTQGGAQPSFKTSLATTKERILRRPEQRHLHSEASESNAHVRSHPVRQNSPARSRTHGPNFQAQRSTSFKARAWPINFIAPRSSNEKH